MSGGPLPSRPLPAPRRGPAAASAFSSRPLPSPRAGQRPASRLYGGWQRAPAAARRGGQASACARLGPGPSEAARSPPAPIVSARPVCWGESQRGRWERAAFSASADGAAVRVYVIIAIVISHVITLCTYVRKKRVTHSMQLHAGFLLSTARFSLGAVCSRAVQPDPCCRLNLQNRRWFMDGWP